MDLKDKIVKTLVGSLQPAYVRLDEEEGISGFVVSDRFQGISGLERQEMLDKILQQSSLTQDERQQILMIAALTPEEYETVGARIRVHRVKEMAGGAVDISLHGSVSDAEYVRGVFAGLKGVKTTEPKPVPGAVGILMHFRAKGSQANPLTKEKALRSLKKDQYIEVMSNA